MELEKPGEERKKRWEATAAEKSGTTASASESESEVDSSEKQQSSAAVEVEFSRERGFLFGVCGGDDGFKAAGKRRSLENQRWKLFFFKVDIFFRGEKMVNVGI